MKRNLSFQLCSVAACMLAALVAGAEDVSFMEPLFVPRPAEVTIRTNESVSLSSVKVSCANGGDKAAAWAAGRCAKWFGGVPAVEAAFSGKPVPGGDEAYELSAGASGVAIRANTIRGVRHAMHTLRQSAMPERGTLRTKGWILPGMEIRDRPALSFRGIHFCWFPTVSFEQMERYVRMAAYYKFNYAVIECWGVYKWKNTPDFAWPDANVTADDIKRLCAIAEDEGLTLLPQLNAFGHAAMSRFVGGKHATLDLKPEYEPVFEPLGGWNWCMTNPEARKVLDSMMAELCEAFGSPPYFHIGCDEAEKPSCPTCRAADYAELLLGHLMHIHDFLSERKCRAMMWHDMLIERGDPRWKGFYAKGDVKTADIAERLPKDVVICDWFYGKAKDAYPTLDYFKSLGYDVLTCPWGKKEGIDAQTAHARKIGLYGILATTWHGARGRDFCGLMINNSHAAWGTDVARYGRSFGIITYATHLRQVGWDMGLKHRDSTGFVTDDFPARMWVEDVDKLID